MNADMSMKRAKEVRRGREGDGSDDGSLTPKKPEKQWDWEKDVSALPDSAFTAYTPKTKFAKEAFVLHAKFGKGVVVAVEAQKVDILFQEGPKKLAHSLA
jgi:hypothetical protein